MSVLPVTLDFLDAAGTTTVLTITDTGAVPTSSGWRVVSLTPVEVQWRRDTVTAPDVAGELETACVAGNATYGMVLQARHTTWAGLQALIDAATAAATQASWRLRVTVGGSATVWRCRRADWSAPLETPGVWVLQRNLTLAVPVDPYPI
jgi:hypothetical protein